jgi:hypothetical protein
MSPYEAMLITTQEEADAFFEAYVQEVMAWDFPPVPVHRDEAERIVRGNIYWHAKQNCDTETQARINKLFRCHQ